jgi:glycosyltransferase involved in cell wall biosynthesis
MKAHILFIADGRSPTTQSWIQNVHSLDYEVSLISTFICDPLPSLSHFDILPIAFSRFSSGTVSKETQRKQSGLKAMLRRFSSILQVFRYWLGPLTILRYARTYKNLIKQIRPDLVHALRIPFEGMLGSYTPQGIPFIAATWGNDLTLHALGSHMMIQFTKRCINRADGLSSDTHRDVELAFQRWGLKEDTPTLVVPGSGGLDLQLIQKSGQFTPAQYNIPPNQPWVVNPRGLRPGSVQQMVFFEAIPQVLKEQPDVCFICPGLSGVTQAENWVDVFGGTDKIFLLPKLPQEQLWDLFRRSQVFVSPSRHDGTPNTLLESMACGTFPVVGDIVSLREWIKNGVNGYLVNPGDPNQLACRILDALNNNALREDAAKRNHEIIENRASRMRTLPRINAFYQQFINKL